MPYSVNDPKLPSNVKGLPDKQKRQWVQIWNSTYQSCTKDGGDAKTCESKAFRVANGVIKKGKRMRIVEAVKAVFRDRDTIIEEADVPEVPRSNDTKLVELSTRSQVRRVNGKTRLFSISAVAAKNRVGEIDSRSLFDSMASIARTTGKYPKRDFMHYGMWNPAFITGDVVFMARDGNCLVTVTEYNDSELAQAEIKARAEQPETWGDSIAYVSLDDPEVLREDGEEQSTLVLNFGFCKYVSTVPEKIAASHFTRGTVEVIDMQDRDLEILAQLMGDEEKARAWVEKYVGDVERAIEDAEMMTRATDPDPEPQDEPVMEYEVDEGLMESLAQRATDAMQAKFDALQAGLDQLSQAVETLSRAAEERYTIYERRLAELEKTEEEIVEEVRRDMPRSARVNVTYRPRDNRSNGRDDEPELIASDEQAERVLETWNTDWYPK